MIDFILEVNLIGIETIDLMLVILEPYHKYKPCILVCNRFKLAENLGHSLVSITFDYSPILRYFSKPSLQVLDQLQQLKEVDARAGYHSISCNAQPTRDHQE